MARMRSAKLQLKSYLQSPGWRDHLDTIAQGGSAHVGPLFSFLLLDPCMRHRAAVALGLTVARMTEDSTEAGRNIIRRFMWHLNEESGNIGWGIPESFGETLVASSTLAKDFHRVLISYVIDLGRDDNYCDNNMLRRSAFWAIGRLAQERQELCLSARQWLLRGLQDEDEICRGMAAWALAQLPPDFMDAPALKKLVDSGCDAVCELFDGNDMYEKTVTELAQAALDRCTKK